MEEKLRSRENKGLFKVTQVNSTSLSTHRSEVKGAQSCPTLCDPLDSSPPGSSVHGTLQARILENGKEWLPFLSPGDLPNSGMEPRSSTLQVDSLPAEPPRKPTRQHKLENKEFCTVQGAGEMDEAALGWRPRSWRPQCTWLHLP